MLILILFVLNDMTGAGQVECWAG